jgi:starch synthase
MPRGLRILQIASEVKPFSKTGGLADMVAALAHALGRLGHEVTIVTPRYRGIGTGLPSKSRAIEVAGVSWPIGFVDEPLGDRLRLVFVDCPPLFDRAGIYLEGGADYPDNPVRFALLARAAVEWAASERHSPDVVHGHDWQAGLGGVYFRDHFDSRPSDSRLPAPGSRLPAPGSRLPTPGSRRIPFVFTIHNIAYQGLFDKSWVPRLGLAWNDFTMAGFEFWDQVSFLKAGVNISAAVTTVSPTYADEIQRPEYGCGFEGVIRARRDALTGILNGIDTDEWDPARDPHLPEPFDATRLAGKAAAKRALLELFGLPTDADALARPLVGMVSRMVDQKGLDLIAAAASELPSLEATFVVIGTGEPRYQDMWTTMARGNPDRIAVFVGFDERRAHLVEAGADIFLMPSRFEPCGLNQMYSLRYGTVPVARAVGGLVDTVRPFDASGGRGNGFLFSAYHRAAMLHALKQALAAFQDKKRWTRLQKNGMRVNFSWDRSAAEYVKVYRRAIGAAKPGRRAGI